MLCRNMGLLSNCLSWETALTGLHMLFGDMIHLISYLMKENVPPLHILLMGSCENADLK